MSDRPAEQTVTIAALRALTAAGPGEIEGMIRARVLTVRDGRVGLVVGVRAYLDAVRAKARAASLTAAAEASRLARAEADEVLVAAADRTLIPQADATEAIGMLAGAINVAFSAIPTQATRIVPERRRLDEALRRAQTAWAKRLHDLDEIPTKPAPRKRGKRKEKPHG